ncbi:toprim domain-containing protein (plasmid) [Bacillus subtilis]
MLCTDNDKAGKTFINAVQTQINAKELFPPQGKDWNEYIQIKKNNGPIKLAHCFLKLPFII